MKRRSRKVTIGMFKAMPKKWDVEGNFAVFEDQFSRHRKDAIDVFITPECFLDGYAVTDKKWTVRRFAKAAQDVDESPYIRRV